MKCNPYFRTFLVRVQSINQTSIFAKTPQVKKWPCFVILALKICWFFAVLVLLLVMGKSLWNNKRAKKVVDQSSVKMRANKSIFGRPHWNFIIQKGVKIFPPKYSFKKM